MFASIEIDGYIATLFGEFLGQQSSKTSVLCINAWEEMTRAGRPVLLLDYNRP